MIFTLRRKITLSYTLLFIILFGLMGVFLSSYFSRQYIANLEQSLLSQATLLADLSEGLSDADLMEFADNVSETLGLRITVIDSTGVPRAETDKPVAELENHLSRPEVQAALRGEAATATRYSDTLGIELLYAGAPVYSSDGQLIGVFRLAKPLTVINRSLGAIRKALLGTLVAGSLLSWLVGSLLTGAITGSLAKLTQRARDIGRGYFHSESAVESGDEVAELDLVINEMSINIQDMISASSREQIRLEKIIQNLPVGVIVLNKQGVVLATNDAACNILNAGVDGINKPLIHLTRDYKINEFVQAVLDSERELQMELVLDREANERLYIRMQGAGVIKNSRGENEEIVIVLQDVSDLRRMEQQRRDLVANVSHELRTPLTAIQGFAETLMDAKVDQEENTRFLCIIRDESVRLSRLINDLLNLSRLESGQRPKEGKTDIRVAAEAVTALLSEQATKRQQELYVNISPRIFVAVDQDSVEQILMNFVENAIKYTPDGACIKIDADVLDNNFARLTVIDNGPGIPPAEQQRLFQRFYRVEKSRQRQGGGTGLGLAIVKHIVEGFGGDVGVISNPGTGTSFWATLPLK